MLGLVVAPVVVAILIAFVEIYREHFGEMETEAAPPEAD
jgi:predicted PurR-regulated permease PerM